MGQALLRLEMTHTTIPQIFRKFSVMDDLFHRMENLVPNYSEYPPPNIVKTGDNEYLLDMAVAGFTKNDIKVYVEEHTLFIEGEKIKKVEKSDETVLVRGIAERSFKKTFMLDADMEVNKVSLQDGILSICVVQHKVEPKQKLLSIE